MSKLFRVTVDVTQRITNEYELDDKFDSAAAYEAAMSDAHAHFDRVIRISPVDSLEITRK